MVNWDFLTQRAAAGGQGVVMVMLSLNLIVLAFFILLNALSKPSEDLTAAALYSVQDGFDYRSMGKMHGDDPASLDGPVWVPRVGRMVQGQVTNLFPLLDDRVLEVAVDEVRLTLPAGDVWDEEGGVRQPVRTLLGNLLALQREEVEDMGIGVDILGGEDALRVVRIGALANVVGGRVGWFVEGDGAVRISLRAAGVGVPDFARRTEKLAGEQGVMVEGVGGREAGDGSP